MNGKWMENKNKLLHLKFSSINRQVCSFLCVRVSNASWISGAYGERIEETQ